MKETARRHIPSGCHSDDLGTIRHARESGRVRTRMTREHPVAVVMPIREFLADNGNAVVTTDQHDVRRAPRHPYSQSSFQGDPQDPTRSRSPGQRSSSNITKVKADAIGNITLVASDSAISRRSTSIHPLFWKTVPIFFPRSKYPLDARPWILRGKKIRK